jgi:hypothetical protein
LCHLRPIWPPVLPLNLTYILRFLLPLPWANLPYNIPSTKSHIHFISLRSFVHRIHPSLRLLENFFNKFIFYGEELLAPRPTSKLENHSLLAVHDCLFSIFAATLHSWRVSPPSATWGRAMPWWQGTHLTWIFCIHIWKILKFIYCSSKTTLQPLNIMLSVHCMNSEYNWQRNETKWVVWLFCQSGSVVCTMWEWTVIERIFPFKDWWVIDF